MNKPLLIYCYDAYCGWCYGFSPVIKQIAEEFKSVCDIEVLSGGMILPEKPTHIKIAAEFISNSYKIVEETTGVKFGSDYLWHIFNPDDSDWYPHSEKPAIALCILKEYDPNKSIEFACDFQYALHYEGRDLTDKEAYRHLLEKYSIREESFYQKLNAVEFQEIAQYEFALVKKLQVKGYPSVFIQTKENSFHLVAQGYTDYVTLKDRILNVLK